MGNKYRFFIYVLLAAGFALSALSATSLCNFGGCTEAHQYRLMGLSLPGTGMAFFIGAGILLALARRFPLAGLGLNMLMAGAAGSEINMILLQKNVIKAWCPICLGIAFIVYFVSALQLGRYFITFKERFHMSPKFVYKPLLICMAALAGFIISFHGLDKPAAAESQLNFSMGKQDSKLEVYFFSDWFCPFCAGVEDVIDSVYPDLSKKAKILFVDKIIHQESMNFVPYHLSFAAYEKAKYIQLRKTLFAVAKKTKNPTFDDIKAAIAPLKVTYKQLGFLEVTQQMTANQKLAEQFKVTSTPSLVIRNAKTNKMRTLVGNAQITKEQIMKAVKELE